jgi:tripartite-type tricarboxylate transporter receptor subunit TctC
MKGTLLLAVAVLGFTATPDAGAQKYPTKPVRLISPFVPGGGTDILSRTIAVPLAETFKQPVVVDNRAGAGGATGAELVANAEPDGYTLIMVSSSYAATSAYGKPSYDPIKGIQPIILMGITGLVMTVHPSVPAKSVKELIDHAKANPAKLNYATVGPGSVTHLSHELFKLETGTNIVHVPYKGGAPALNAVIAGEVQLTMISMVPHLKAGRLRALGLTSPKRSSLLPDVPTINEIVPGYEVVHWYGIWAPRRTPAHVVALWNSEVGKILTTEEMKNRMRGEGLEGGGGAPQQLGEVIARDIEKWRRVVKEAKIKREG